MFSSNQRKLCEHLQSLLLCIYDCADNRKNSLNALDCHTERIQNQINAKYVGLVVNEVEIAAKNREQCNDRKEDERFWLTPC